MFLELISDVLMNSAMFYMYFGLILATIGISQLLIMQYHTVYTRNSLYTEKVNIQLYATFEKQSVVFNEPFIVWFGKSCKRMFTTDDDLEDDSLSYFMQIDKIRGGQLWIKTVYAPSFGNIDMYF